MSLVGFTDGIYRDMLNASSKGLQMTSIWMCPEGMEVLLKGASREASFAMDLVPETRIHGIPVKEHKRIPRGHVWYVYKPHGR